MSALHSFIILTICVFVLLIVANIRIADELPLALDALASVAISSGIISLVITCKEFVQCSQSKNRLTNLNWIRVIRWCCLSMILVAMCLLALPGFTGSAMKKKDLIVKTNMMKLQSELEEYARKHGGVYPAGLEFAGAFVNPFTHKQELPVIGVVDDVETAKKQAPEVLSPGTIEYSPIRNKSGIIANYAVRGAGSGGETFSETYMKDATPATGTLVLTHNAKTQN